ncbi:MAG: sigma-54 dependent transcriptional regulator [Rhodobacteraceae bacterium]|nr:sigma-54 dependent transcriptional regulator [Paracoccaceae bacterium]
MTHIAFSTDAPRVEGLRYLLEAQGVSIVDDGPCHTLIVGAITGPHAKVVAEAKELGAKRIIAIDDAAPAWAIREELGGRLLHAALPAEAGKPDRDGAHLLLAHLIAAPFGRFMAADPASTELRRLSERVALHDVSVFINGPTGSGKEVLSRFIHETSPRAKAPFIALNCAAIPENMLEAMLFGHEKGAFTGATGVNKGHVRAADGGTLLLDEVSEMPPALQAKLLRVIQEKTVTPIGSQSDIPVDVRFIATSNRDMVAEVRRGTFREDLYYRLNVFPLTTLPLAKRPRDIPVLAQALLVRHAPAAPPLLTAAALDALGAHDWPGNVRELENVLQRALVLTNTATIDAGDVALTPSSARLLSVPGADDRRAA